MLHSCSVPGVSSPTGLVPVKQRCARNRSQSCGLGACICSATAPASFSWWGCHSLPQPRCPKGSLPTHVLCQRLCHCSSAAQLLIFTHHHSQPDLQLQDGRRKPVALPRALGCAEPPQLPHCPGRGQRVQWGWHGRFPAASWAGAVGRDAGEPVQQPRSPHGNTSTGAEIPPVSEAEASHDASLSSPESSSGHWCLLVSSKGLSRRLLVAQAHQALVKIGVGAHSWHELNQVSCAPHPQFLLCSEEQILHRNCTKPQFWDGDGLW